MSKNEEDIVLKAIANGPINVFLNKLGFDSKTCQILNSELFVVNLSARRADLILKLDNMYLIIEFQSSKVFRYDKKRFSTYAHMFDLNKDDNLPVYLCVLSTAEKSKMVKYSINDKSVFIFSIVSLWDDDESEIINNIGDKISNKQDISIEELVDFALIPLITKEKDKEYIFSIVEDLIFEVDFPDLQTKDFVLGIILLLSNKLLDNGEFKKILEGKLMGQLECVSRYVNERFEEGIKEGMEKGIKEGMEKGMEESSKEIAISLLKNGLSEEFVALNTKLPLSRVRKLKVEC